MERLRKQSEDEVKPMKAEDGTGNVRKGRGI
jgi:hypothetical protein